MAIEVGNAQRASELYQEVRSIDRAVAGLGNGGKILQMLIEGPPSPPPGPPITVVAVDTRGMTYPQAMTDAIIQQLHARRALLDSELRTLGFNGAPPPAG